MQFMFITFLKKKDKHKNNYVNLREIFLKFYLLTSSFIFNNLQYL
jgi:hypothetical protein